MRALKAILTAAGNLKRVMTDAEEVICLRALMDVNVPKFTLNDVPLFLSIISDLFPDVKFNESENSLAVHVKDTCNKLGLEGKKSFIEKCI